MPLAYRPLAQVSPDREILYDLIPCIRSQRIEPLNSVGKSLQLNRSRQSIISEPNRYRSFKGVIECYMAAKVTGECS